MRFPRNNSLWRLAASFLLLVSLPGLVPAQQPPPDMPAPVLRVTTRLVLVDVLVTNKNGQRVEGLTPADFTLLENKKPQQIAFFSWEQPGRRANAARGGPAPLPPNIYTNRPEYRSPPGALTVLLLDALNTGVQDQAYARAQMLRYLATQLKPDQWIAVYALGQSLRVLQDFTDDPRLLRAAVESFNPEKPLELTIEDVNKRLPPAPREFGSKEGGSINPTVSMVVERLREFATTQATVALNVRVAKTLKAFQMIARALAGYPGRKNLVWVSASFPLAMTSKIVKMGTPGPELNLGPGQFRIERSYAEDLQQTSAQLTDAQIAVYPVDARGLMGSTLTTASDPGTNELGLGRLGAEFGEQVSNADSKLLDTQATMEQLANETGGRVLKNRNDVDNSVALSLADGSSYYLLGYYPEDKNWDGKFHKIQVNVAQPKLQVRHRQGYFAVDPTQWGKQAKEDRDAELMSVMGPDSPLATGMIFDARVVPPAPASRVQVPVELLIDMRTLSFEEKKGGERLYSLEFHVAAYAPDGKMAAHHDARVDAPIKAETVAARLQQGFPYRTQLELPPGRYRLRLAVRDNRTGFLGTTEVPLVLEKPAAEGK